MSKLELYYKDTCPYCQKVFRMIDKYNLKDKVDYKDIAASSECKDELVNIGGMNQVPCLFIDGKPMYESGDIIQYLKDNLL